MTVYQELKMFRWIGILEGISFITLLGVAMPLKYVAGMPLAVTYVGWAHGFLFVIYFAALAWVALSLKWSFKQVAKYALASVVPAGPLFMEKQLKELIQKHRP